MKAHHTAPGRPIISVLRLAGALFICGSLLAAGAGAVASGQGGPPPVQSRGNTLESRAEAARAAGRLDEAAELYRQALAARPRWAEGLWALGTIAYEQDRFAECRGGVLAPGRGPAEDGDRLGAAGPVRVPP